MPNIESWEFWNSSLIDTVLVAFLGGVIVAYLADRWQRRQKRHEFQLEVFRKLLSTTGRIGNGYSALYEAIKSQDQSQIEDAQKRARKADDELEGLDWEIVAAFPYKTANDDVHAIKEASSGLAKAAKDQVSDRDFDEASRHFIKSAAMMHRRLMREMGLLSTKQYGESVAGIKKAFD